MLMFYIIMHALTRLFGWARTNTPIIFKNRSVSHVGLRGTVHRTIWSPLFVKPQSLKLQTASQERKILGNNRLFTSRIPLRPRTKKLRPPHQAKWGTYRATQLTLAVLWRLTRFNPRQWCLFADFVEDLICFKSFGFRHTLTTCLLELVRY